jgi:xanthosine utilization system XapX-like protein
MPDELPPTPESPEPTAGWSREQAGRLRLGLIVALVALLPLSWLLARLIWLPFYFGLFFFLVAGLLVGAVAFRVARAARPAPGRMVIRGAILVSILVAASSVCWEHRHIASNAGTGGKFPNARNAAVAAGRSPREVAARATEAFNAQLDAQYAPGGTIGYVRWAALGGPIVLTVNGDDEKIVNDHQGIAWIVRTLFAVALMTAGLWSSLESLRCPAPVSNILAPGADYEDAE